MKAFPMKYNQIPLCIQGLIDDIKVQCEDRDVTDDHFIKSVIYKCICDKTGDDMLMRVSYLYELFMCYDEALTYVRECLKEC